MIVLGAVGLFLPFLQGVLFLFIGVSLLATQVPAVKRFKDRLEARYPRQFQGARAAKGWFLRKLGRTRGEEAT